MSGTLIQDAVSAAKPTPRHRRPAEVVGTVPAEYERVLTHRALLFIADLERRFGGQRKMLLENRKLAQIPFLKRCKTAASRLPVLSIAR